MVYEILHNPTFDLKSSLDALNNLKNLYLITKLSYEHIQNYLSETRKLTLKKHFPAYFGVILNIYIYENNFVLYQRFQIKL